MSFYSCNTTEKNIKYLEGFSSPIGLTDCTECMLTDLLNPVNFEIKDSLLFTVESKDNTYAKCINLKTGKQIAKFLSKGRGPGEFIHCSSISLYGNDSIQFYGVAPPRIITYSIKDILNNKYDKYTEINIPNKIEPSRDAFKLNANQIFMAGSAKDGKHNTEYCSYLLEKDSLYFWGEFNENFFKDSNLYPHEKSYLYQPSISFFGDKAVAFMSNFKGIEILNLKKQVVLKRLYYESPKWIFKTLGEGKNSLRFVKSDKDMWGYLDSACNKDFIFCVYGFTKGYEILVYDWNLNPQKRYVIKTKKKHIVCKISNDCKYFYFAEEEVQGIKLLRYKISK